MGTIVIAAPFETVSAHRARGLLTGAEWVRGVERSASFDAASRRTRPGLSISVLTGAA